ncbi:group 1 truncated hemoglobin [Halorussus limi]|uniref:Group 1 truncated hemoglobin n=1 Tax=Halorussus limi TaxID=2938695 RepID=A0A8U0HRB0_9EURY|nr:group 1 truncated hemoglobin [Halorussus limi]UPV73381.1 group 1 truncated hemoglobin [Halorussus limi]
MSETLYDRLGGRDAIAAVVESFYDRVLDDDRIAHFFEDTDMSALRAHQTTFLASVTGGPVEYDGADLSSAHADLDIDGRDFEIVARHLDEALAEFDVSADDREEVVAAIAELESAIVTAE